MKTTIIAAEPADIERDDFFYSFPPAFHFQRAKDLFEAAERAGLLCWIVSNEIAVDFGGEDPYFALRPRPGGPIKTQAHLAYWCICASTYLGLDRGPTETTYWKPFEDLFGKRPKAFSKATGPLDLDRDPKTKKPIRNSNGWPIAREEYSADIIAFFDSLNQPNGTEQDTTKTQ